MTACGSAWTHRDQSGSGSLPQEQCSPPGGGHRLRRTARLEARQPSAWCSTRASCRSRSAVPVSRPRTWCLPTTTRTDLQHLCHRGRQQHRHLPGRSRKSGDYQQPDPFTRPLRRTGGRLSRWSQHTLVEHAPSTRPSVADVRPVPVEARRLGGNAEDFTRFAEYRGFKGTQGVISPDGTKLCFQLGKSGDEAGVGYGFFVMDLERAEAAGAFGEWTLVRGRGRAGKASPCRSVRRTAWEGGDPLPALSRICSGSHAWTQAYRPAARLGSGNAQKRPVSAV